MLDKDPILNPENVRRDPVRGRPESRKTAMDDDEVTVRHDEAGLVLQRQREVLDEVKQAFAAGSNVRAVLDLCRRPVALGRGIISFVEKGVKGLKDKCPIPLLFRLTHSDPFPTSGLSRVLRGMLI
jgi:hypothetical protein